MAECESLFAPRIGEALKKACYSRGGVSIREHDKAKAELDKLERALDLAAKMARLVCINDVAYVSDPAGARALDLAANELGNLLGLHEPEFENVWRLDDTLGRRSRV